MKKWLPFCKKLLHSKIPNYSLPKVWAAFPSIDENGKLASAIMKKWKNCKSSKRTKKLPIKKGY